MLIGVALATPFVFSLGFAAGAMWCASFRHDRLTERDVAGIIGRGEVAQLRREGRI